MHVNPRPNKSKTQRLAQTRELFRLLLIYSAWKFHMPIIHNWKRQLKSLSKTWKSAKTQREINMATMKPEAPEMSRATIKRIVLISTRVRFRRLSGTKYPPSANNLLRKPWEMPTSNRIQWKRKRSRTIQNLSDTQDFEVVRCETAFSNFDQHQLQVIFRMWRHETGSEFFFRTSRIHVTKNIFSDVARQQLSQEVGPLPELLVISTCNWTSKSRISTCIFWRHS